MGKNKNKKGGNNNSYANDPKTKDKSSVVTSEIISDQNIKEVTNAQDDVQVSDTQIDTQEPQGKEESSVEPEKKISFLQKIGLRLAKPLFDEIEKKNAELETELGKLRTENQECNHQLEECQKELVIKTSDLEESARINAGLNFKYHGLETDMKGLNKELEELRAQLREQTTTHNKKIDELNGLISSKVDEINRLRDSNRSAVATKENPERKFFNKLKNQFQTIITKDMTTDEALNIIYKNIESLKIDVANAKRKKDDAIQKESEISKSLENAQKLAAEAEERVKQIESSDAGQLVEKVENLEKQSESQAGEIKSLKADIDNAKEEISKLTDDKKSIENQLNESKQENIASENKHKEEIATLKQVHQDEISKLRDENRNNVKKMKDDHEEAMRKLKDKHKEEEDTLKKQNEEEKERLVSDHKEEISKMETAHKDAMDKIEAVHQEESSKMQADFKNKEDKFNAEIKSKNESIQSLCEKMKSEYESLRKTSEEAANNLFETLKANEVMNACSDDYTDKVEEKNQELLVSAKKLRTKICELPTTETPSEWTKQLSKVVYELFEDNSSIICKLLKYYAMSNVPCMIDNKREEGVCFIRKNISKAYSSLTILLSQCDITPIIPAIFVENIHESEYEVEGSFNDIESFCPGSINEHIEHIERDSDGLDGIIVGVTKVGFKSADGKLVKTQVIIK